MTNKQGDFDFCAPLCWLGLLPFEKVVDNFDAEYEVT